MDLVLQTLAELEVPIVLDAGCKSVKTFKCESDQVVTVVTSEAAIREYDSYHPERIECILLRSGAPIQIIVNNREQDVPAMVRTWMGRALHSYYGDLDCQVCYRQARDRIYHLHVCPTCSFRSCHACLSNLEVDDDVHQCPQCRQWLLSGNEFGTPLERLPGVPLPGCGGGQEGQQRLAAVDRLMQMIGRLDGEVLITLRVGKRFMEPPEPLSVCRLTHTTRYCQGHMAHRELWTALRRALVRLRDDPANETAPLQVYVSRKTYGIDRSADGNSRPIMEVSVLQVSDDGTGLHQLSTDAWVNVFDTPYAIRKVEYLSPAHVFPVPDYVFQLFRQLNEAHPGRNKTVSVVRCRREGRLDYGINFDVDGADGRIATMHPDMVRVCLHNLLVAKGGHRCYALVRIDSSPGGGGSTARLEAYEFHPHEYRRLGPQECREVFELDLDGLKNSVRVREFL